MIKSSETFSTTEKVILQVERAIADLKIGMPVQLEDEDAIFAAAETVSDEIFFKVFQAEESYLVISDIRAKFLRVASGYIKIPASSMTFEEIKAISGLTNNVSAELKSKINKVKEPAGAREMVAIKLAKLSHLLPAVLMSYSYIDLNLACVMSGQIYEYEDLINYDLREVETASLTLQNNISAKMKLFRPKLGGQEHYAIIIGDINKLSEPPMVRLHSSCFTGDILGSLACDCQEQLHMAVNFIASSKDQAGIILYINQEGRGIGLANTLRSFNYQELGLDTVEANHALGYEGDERNFMPAASMLKQLNKRDIRLITNNPKKAEDIRKYGINIVSTIGMQVTENDINKDYLKTKVEKMGHKIGV